MTYRDTARAFIRAETADAVWTNQAHWLDSITRGIPENQATGYEPNRTARRYAEHVESLAAEMREVLGKWENSDGTEFDDFAYMLANASRALLAAIGEDADA